MNEKNLIPFSERTKSEAEVGDIMGNCSISGSPIQGLPNKVYRQLKAMAANGEMPGYIMGNTDAQIAVFKGINALYPDVSENDIKKYKIKYILGDRYTATVGNSTVRASVPHGAENDADVKNGVLKKLVANIKKRDNK